MNHDHQFQHGIINSVGGGSLHDEHLLIPDGYIYIQTQLSISKPTDFHIIIGGLTEPILNGSGEVGVGASGQY